MNDTDKKQAIAEQVIVSAGNILVAAGFEREEIGEFFRQAADQLAPLCANAATATSVTRNDAAPDELAPVHSVFRRSKPVIELHSLAIQARDLPPLAEDGPQLKASFDLAMQMVPLLAEAQNGLRALAQEASLPFYASREEWMTSAGTSDLSGQSPAICLEDFAPAYSGAFETISEVLEELLRRKDVDAFTFLLGHLADNGVAIDSGLRASIEKGARLLPG